MFGPFERAVAGRYLRARKGERFVSIIALFSLVSIALGVAVLIIVMSVMGGFQVDLLSRILGFNGHVGVYGQARAPLRDYEPLATRIRTVPGVLAAAPVIDGQVLMSGPRGQNAGAMVRGISQADIRNVPAIAKNMRQGTLDDYQGEDAIAIGVGVAQQFGLQVGDDLTLISPNGAATAFGTVPRVRAYRVAAIFEVGMHEYDSSFVFVPLAAAQIFFQAPDRVDHIEVFADDPSHVGRIKADISRVAGAPVTVVDWEANNNSYFAAIQVERNVMFLILTLIIVVAAFNVISSLIMMVKDKTRDIAILRTIGAGRWAVLRIFLMAGASIGVTGTLVGVVIGVVFCLNIETIQGWVERITSSHVFNPEVYYLTHLPSKLDPVEVMEVVVLALGLSLLATIYPSWRAARTDPVEALRHE